MNYQGIINYPGPKQEYKVLVRCFTYNQKTYIEDALNGFAMQQTNFPFVCLVMDDASTDGEQDVIKAWMERECDMSKAETIEIPSSIVIIVPHKANSSCTFAFYFLIKNLYKDHAEKIKHVTPWRERCEYEAICEGDDYWKDPLKLQKQVDFLEENPEYGLVHTLAKVFIDKTQTYRKSYIGNSKNSLEEILVDNPIVTNTVCVKTQLILDYIREEIFNSRWLMGDYPMWLYVAGKEKIHFIPEVTSVYRILENSASHSSDFYKQIDFYYSSLEISEFFAHYYNKKDIIKYKRNLVFINIVRLYIKNNKRFQFEMIKNEYKKSFISVKLLILIIFSQFEIMRLYLNKRWNK